jgi:signal transduction histidine kinase
VSVPVTAVRRGSTWIPASAVALACAAVAALVVAVEPGGPETLPLALAIALLSLAALLRPFEPAPGEKFSLAGAVAFFGALVLPGAQAVAAIALAECAARVLRRTSLVSALVNVSKSVGAVAAASALALLLRTQAVTVLEPREVVAGGAAYLIVTLAAVGVMIAWTQGAGAVRAFVAREWLPTATLLAIGGLAAAVWAAQPLFIVLFALPLAMVEIAGRNAARVRAAHVAVSKALDAQRAFVADAAHELRNPLTAIRGNIAFVESDALSAEESAALADARTDLGHLSALVERLLLLSRADAQAPTAARADLSAIAVTVAREVARRPEVALDIDVPGRVDVAASAELVAAMVRDLVSNAAAYTERGSVHVAVREAEGVAMLEVRDTGVGIPQAELPRVFDRFFRGSAARRLAPGSGLGLAIARRIAEAHGGSVEVLPADGGGTVARVLLPRVRTMGEGA